MVHMSTPNSKLNGCAVFSPVPTSSSFYSLNMSILEKHYPDVAQKVADFSLFNINSDKYSEAVSKDGHPLLCVQRKTGRKSSFDDPVAPIKASRRWASQYWKDSFRNVILVGFGTGYCPFALLEKISNFQHLWIVEPEIELFYSAMVVMDLSSLLSSPHISLYVGDSAEETAKKMLEGSKSYKIMFDGVHFIVPNFAQTLYKDFIQKMTKFVQDKVAEEMIQHKTADVQATRIFSNTAKNLKLFSNNCFFNQLEGIAKDRPVFVIGAGPSLSSSVEYLKSVQPYSCLVAVDTAYRILKKNGITPDFVVSLDFTELNARHFQDKEEDDSRLICYPGVDPSIPERYVGRTYFFDHSGDIDYTTSAASFLILLQAAIGPMGTLISYGSTSHAAYHAARLMEGDPIVFVGQDLSFPGNKLYSSGAMQESLKQPERETERKIPVVSNSGGTAMTNELYHSFLKSFEIMIGSLGGNIFNVSLDGAKIEGTTYKSMEEISYEITNKKLNAFFIKPEAPNCGIELQKIISGRLEEIKSATIRFAENLKNTQKKIKSLDASLPVFKKNLIDFMSEFVNYSNVENMAVALCIPLCPRSVSFMMKDLDSLFAFYPDSIEGSRESQERCLTLVSDMERAARFCIDRFESMNG